MSNKLRRFRDDLIKSISNASQVFIVGHNNPDYDSIGSSLALATLTKALGKKSYIIINDLQAEIDSGIKNILDTTSQDYAYITLAHFQGLVDRDSLLLITDVNKKYLISVQNELDKPGKIMVIDHHEEDSFSVPANNQLIEVDASSACEIVTQILLAKKIPISAQLANYLLAGILLDTKRFQKNAKPNTFDTVEKLCRKGADYDAVNRLFISNFLEDDKIYSLIFGKKSAIEEKDGQEQVVEIRNTQVQAYSQLLGNPTVSFTLNRINPMEKYKQVELAKTADKMLKYADVSFVMGYVSDTDVGISARSRGDMDVGNILGKLQYVDFPLLSTDTSYTITRSGGGNKQNAGGRVTTSDIFSVEKFLMDAVLEMAIEDVPETKEEAEKPVVLVRKIQKPKR